ncbi:hypothetical protein NL676_024203 [Syzygium grande]|nr:hypothetical protein NL676_024203 [Syzygium grande]
MQSGGAGRYVLARLKREGPECCPRLEAAPVSPFLILWFLPSLTDFSVLETYPRTFECLVFLHDPTQSNRRVPELGLHQTKIKQKGLQWQFIPSSASFAPPSFFCCLMWFGDFIDIKEIDMVDNGQYLFLRLPASELDSIRSPSKKLVTIIVASTISGLLLVGMTLSIIWKRRMKRRALVGMPCGTDDIDLPLNFQGDDIVAKIRRIVVITCPQTKGIEDSNIPIIITTFLGTHGCYGVKGRPLNSLMYLYATLS